MKSVNLVNPDSIPNEIKTQINAIKNRILFLSPSVSSGEEREAKKEDFESLSEKNIGVGGFGQVYKVRHKTSHNIYAIKVISKAKILERDLIEQIKLEIRIMYSINHEHIVKLYNHFEDEDNFYLILQYCSNGELYQKLKLAGTFNEKSTAQYIREVISAVEYLHSHQPPIIHRDIKPENVLLDDKEGCKLADFGWSNFFNSDQKRKTYCGTPAYLAPEMIKQSGHDKSLDLWNIGVLLFELLTGRPPFEGTTQNELFHNIEHVKISWTKDFPNLAKDLVCKLLKVEPKQRISIPEMKSHPWLQLMPIIRPIYEAILPLKKVTQNVINSEDYEVVSAKSTKTKCSEEQSKKSLLISYQSYADIAGKISDPREKIIKELNDKILTLTRELQKEHISNEINKKEIIKLNAEMKENLNNIGKLSISSIEQRKLLEEFTKLKLVRQDRDALIAELEIKNAKLNQIESENRLQLNSNWNLENANKELENKLKEAKEKLKEIENNNEEIKRRMEETKKEKDKKIMLQETKIEELQYRLLERQVEKAEEEKGEGVYEELLSGIKEIYQDIKTKICYIIDNNKNESAIREECSHSLRQVQELKLKAQNDMYEMSLMHAQDMQALQQAHKAELNSRMQQKDKEYDAINNKYANANNKIVDIQILEARHESIVKSLGQTQKSLDDSALLVRLINQEKCTVKSKHRALLTKIGELEYQLALKKDQEFKAQMKIGHN